MTSAKQTGSKPSVELIPRETLPPKIDLRDSRAIRRELAAVYRDARTGKIETQDATRLGYLLNLLGQAHERQELEARIETLEKLQHDHD